MDIALKECLSDLEARIDLQEEERLLQAWRDFTAGRFDGDVFSPRRGAPTPPRVEWPRVSINAALEDFDAMALQQYGNCSKRLAEGNGHLLDVRCNYGTSIIPLLFGVEPFVMDEAHETLPTSRPLNDVDAIRRLADAGPPDVCRPSFLRVLEMGERYAAIARAYPRIGRAVHVTHPDFQGPMDVCEIIWGSSIFYALYDQPDLVHALLEIVTTTYAACMHAWTEIVPFGEGGNAHWGLYHGGNLMLRDDSAMNLSPDTFDAFVRPYDERLLAEFGGGAVHFCGRGDHFIDRLSGMEGVYAVNLSQPEYNAMETIFTHTVDEGINLIGLGRAAVEEALAAGRDLHGRVHVVG